MQTLHIQKVPTEYST